MKKPRSRLYPPIPTPSLNPPMRQACVPNPPICTRLNPPMSDNFRDFFLKKNCGQIPKKKIAGKDFFLKKTCG